MNPDDIRARGKGVGFDVLLNGKNTITISVKGKEFLMNCWGSYQPALDLIEAEERRQACGLCGGKGEVLIIGDVEHDKIGPKQVHAWVQCPTCKGTREKVKEDE